MVHRSAAICQLTQFHKTFITEEGSLKQLQHEIITVYEPTPFEKHYTCHTWIIHYEHHTVRDMNLITLAHTIMNGHWLLLYFSGFQVARAAGVDCYTAEAWRVGGRGQINIIRTTLYKKNCRRTQQIRKTWMHIKWLVSVNICTLRTYLVSIMVCRCKLCIYCF